MTVEISHEGRCNDGMSDYEYPDTVRVRFGGGRSGRALEGCGGGVLPPVTLDMTSWQIVDIDGTHVGGGLYKLNFQDDGQMRGQAGCNRFSAPYTQTRRTLTAGAISVTRMACSDEPRSHEAKALRLLSGPVEIRYRGGMIMVLSAQREGTHIFMTLRRL